MNLKAVAFAGLVLVAAYNPAYAQAPVNPSGTPDKGMSKWAFNLSLGAGLANVGAQEYLFYRAGAGNKAKLLRVGLAGLSVSLPFVAKWFTRNAPRSDANGVAVNLAAWSTFGTGTYLYVTIKLPPK